MSAWQFEATAPGFRLDYCRLGALQAQTSQAPGVCDFSGPYAPPLVSASLKLLRTHGLPSLPFCVSVIARENIPNAADSSWLIKATAASVIAVKYRFQVGIFF